MLTPFDVRFQGEPVLQECAQHRLRLPARYRRRRACLDVEPILVDPIGSAGDTKLFQVVRRHEHEAQRLVHGHELSGPEIRDATRRAGAVHFHRGDVERRLPGHELTRCKDRCGEDRPHSSHPSHPSYRS